MKKTVSKKYEIALTYLGEEVRLAVEKCLRRMGRVEGEVNEIRLRAHGASAIVLGGENVAIDLSLDENGIKEIFKRILGGALFAHREDICRGFVSLVGGIRVGVSGRARYEGGRVVGIGDVTSLVVRIPTGECSFADRLYRGWLLTGGGMLICSSAGEGKTTAIRSLARLIGSGENPRRVVVVDERCEFDPTEYKGAHVDVLSGYRRALGVDIALRTMSAEVLIVDEISTPDDADAMLGSLGAGVTVIATLHARSLSDAMKRDYVKRMIDGGLFESICLISRAEEHFSYRLEKINVAVRENSHGVGDI